MEKSGKSKKSTFAKNLILRRMALGMSAEEFAEHAEMPYPTIRDIEAGASGGNPATRAKIAAKLNCSVDDLNTPGGPPNEPLPWAEQVEQVLQRTLARYEERLRSDRDLAFLDREVTFLRDQNRALIQSNALLSKLVGLPQEIQVFLKAVIEKNPKPKGLPDKLGKALQALLS